MWWACVGSLFACSVSDAPIGAPTGGASATATADTSIPGMPTILWTTTGCTGVDAPNGPERADVEAVSATGGPDRWTVSVTVRSPDVSCDRYADWWELVRPDGELVYRRILDHSHVDEQPFTRASTEPVTVGADDELLVRAHLHPDGYGGRVLRGSLAAGFVDDAEARVGFAEDLESAAPQPDTCLF